MIRLFLKFNLIAIFLVLTSISHADILDPDGPKNDVLSRISGQLDRHGIDVRYGSNASTTIPQRPQLTPLNTFQTTSRLDFTESTFLGSFANGFAFESALFAIDNGTGAPLSDPEQFQSRWSDVNPEKRVVISFSSLDIGAATQVAEAFNGSGYSTFLFTGQDSAGKFNAVDTGNYFRQAGHRFVVDTVNSRPSLAVAAEAMFARNPSRLDNVGRPSGLFGNDSESQFGCCQMCTYRNGALVGCGQTICGAQCQGARR